MKILNHATVVSIKWRKTPSLYTPVLGMRTIVTECVKATWGEWSRDHDFGPNHKGREVDDEEKRFCVLHHPYNQSSADCDGIRRMREQNRMNQRGVAPPLPREPHLPRNAAVVQLV